MHLYLLLSLPVLKKAYNILKSRASFFSDKLICQFVWFVNIFFIYIVIITTKLRVENRKV